MKNLLIYTNAFRKFSDENQTLVKVQIDNSLSLGWDPKDILLFTNFHYEYNGVRSIVIPDLSYKPDRTNKIPAIIYLLKNFLLPEDSIWYHDFDAFQDGGVSVQLTNDIGFTPYGYKPQWNAGSFFFTPLAQDFFEFWDSKIRPRTRADEKALTDLTKSGGLKFAYDTFGVEYNYGQRLHEFPQYDTVERRVLHFHPQYKYYKAQYNNLDIFMYGKNRLNKPLMSERLIEIFNHHGIK